MIEPKVNGVSNKKQCEDCLKYYRKVYPCRDGKRRCNNCKRKQVTNKWFIPKELRKPEQRIGKFNMTLQEKNLLHKQGHSWREINGACKYMKKVSWTKKKEYWNKQKQNKLKESNEKTIMKNLIEGLK